MKKITLLYQIKDLSKDIIVLLTRTKSNNQKKQIPTTSQIRIVEYIIKNNDRPVYQKDIEKYLCITRATLSGVLKTMEKNGIIKRITNSTDARSKQIIINDSIKEKFIENEKELLEIEKKITKDINKEEIDIFLKILNKMKKNIDNILEKDDLND